MVLSGFQEQPLPLYGLVTKPSVCKGFFHYMSVPLALVWCAWYHAQK